MVSVAIAFGVAWAEVRGSLDWLENRSSDRRAVATINPSRANRDIVIIDIDNASYRTLTDKLGRWPWTRRVWTELVRYLIPGKPRLILVDILFNGAEPEADLEFSKVISQAGNVVLPFAFASGQIDTTPTSSLRLLWRRCESRAARRERRCIARIGRLISPTRSLRRRWLGRAQPCGLPIPTE